MVDTRHIRSYIEKNAGVGFDYTGGMPGFLIPPVGLGGCVAGTLSGLVAPAPSLETIAKYNKNPALSLIPGVGDWRLRRRRKALRNALKDKDSLFNIKWSEELGSLSSAAVFSALHPRLAPLSILGCASGALAAALTPRRTLAQQQDYENSMLASVLNSTVPGVSTYNHFKSLGATRNLDGKNEEQVAEALAKDREDLDKKKAEKEELNRKKKDKKKENDSESNEKSSSFKQAANEKRQRDLPPAQRGEPKAISGSKAGINPWVTLSNALGRTSPKVQSLLGYNSMEPAPQLKQPERFTFRASTGKAPMPEEPTDLG